MSKSQDHDERPESAAEEVLEEIRHAETDDVAEKGREGTDNGEAGDTLTPSLSAQRSIHRDNR